MQKDHLEVLQKWFDAFNSKNLDHLLSLYDDQAEHFSPKLKVRMPETGGFIKGKQELKNWWKDAFERLPQLNYKPNYFIADEKNVFVEYLRTVPGEDDLIVGEVLFFKGNKIIASKVFHG